METVHCYIDGFNLYYRLYKNPSRKHKLTHYKWLDLEKLCSRLAGQGDLQRVYYFTADIIPHPRDPGQLSRQQTFLNAVTCSPRIHVIKGQFRPRVKSGIPVNPHVYGANPIAFRTVEEKGSDVNLAAMLLRDAFQNTMDRVIVISNDSDLKLAISIAVNDAKKAVQVVSPDLWVVNDLQEVVTRSGVLQPKLVMQCQLPNPTIDSDGNYLYRPAEWAPR